MKNNTPLISIIVPVYKVEDYLDRCVESIVNQTYTNLEIILVDDGSPDNCPAMCDDWAKKDSRIKVIHKQNGGLSSARNAGIDKMTGEYVCFVDSDDWVDLTYVEEMFNALNKENADLSISWYRKVFDNKESTDFVDNNNHILNNQTEILDYFYKISQSLTISLAWNKLYKKDIFNSIRFPDGIVHEDEYIILDVLLNCKKVVVINKILYNYFQRTNSIMLSFNENKKTDAKFQVYNHKLELLNKQKLTNYLHYEMLMSIGNAWIVYKQMPDKESRKYYNQNFKTFWKKNKKYFKLIKKPHLLTFKSFIKLLIMKIKF